MDWWNDNWNLKLTMHEPLKNFLQIKTAVKCKWVFKQKCNSNDRVTFRTKLVATCLSFSVCTAFLNARLEETVSWIYQKVFVTKFLIMQTRFSRLKQFIAWRKIQHEYLQTMLTGLDKNLCTDQVTSDICNKDLPYQQLVCSLSICQD